MTTSCTESVPGGGVRSTTLWFIEKDPKSLAPTAVGPISGGVRSSADDSRKSKGNDGRSVKLEPPPVKFAGSSSADPEATPGPGFKTEYCPLVSSNWAGFNRWRTYAVKPTAMSVKRPFGGHSADEFSNNDCFWLASYLALRSEAQYNKWWAEWNFGPYEGVDELRALEVCRKLEMSLFTHNPYTGELDQVFEGKKKTYKMEQEPGKYKHPLEMGVALVLCDDDDAWSPHALVVSGVKGGRRPEMTYSVYRQYLSKRMKRPVASITSDEVLKEFGVVAPSAVRLMELDSKPVKTNREGKKVAPRPVFEALAPKAKKADLSDAHLRSGSDIATSSNISVTWPKLPPAPKPKPKEYTWAEICDLGAESIVGYAKRTVPAFGGSPTPMPHESLPNLDLVSALGGFDCEGLRALQRSRESPEYPVELFGETMTTQETDQYFRSPEWLAWKESWDSYWRQEKDREILEAVGQEVPPVAHRPHVGAAIWEGGKTIEYNPNCIQLEQQWFGARFWHWLPVRRWITRNPRFLEARESVLLNTEVALGDVLYVRERFCSISNRYEKIGGCFDLTTIRALECGMRHFELGPVVRKTVDGRTYSVAEVVKGVDARGPIRKFFGMIFGGRYRVYRVGMRNREYTEEVTLDGCDAVATARAFFTLYARTLCEELQPIWNDIRNRTMRELMEDKSKKFDPRVIENLAKQLVEQNARVTDTAVGTFKVFGRSTNPEAKCCVNCGCEPPRKYRWKHRMCDDCWRWVNSMGYTTYSGYLLQQGFELPSVGTGVVFVPAREREPNQEKMTGIDLDKGDGTSRIKVAPSALSTRLAFGETVEATQDFYLEDLDKLVRGGEQKAGAAFAGIGCSAAPVMVSASSPYNQAKALLGRAFRQPKYHPADGIFDFARQFLPEIGFNPDGLRTKAMLVEDWIESMPNHRKAPLRRAYEKYRKRGLLPGDALFKAFVKTESLPDFVKEAGELVPIARMLDRLINGPSDVSHIVAGPRLKPKIKKLKEMWHKDNFVFYGSVGPEPLHDWLQRLVQAGESTYLWVDYKMFDNTHSDASWDFVESLYLEDSDEFSEVMRMWRQPHGKIGPFEYWARTMNASGRDDTALANGILNGVAMSLSLSAAFLGKSVWDLKPGDISGIKSEVFLSVCGDDTLARLPPGVDKAELKRLLVENVAQFGFECKVGMSEFIGNAVYLGNRPYPVGGTYYWGKTIGRALYKFGYVVDPKGRDVMAHITGVAEMHTQCSKHVPILADMAQRIVHLRAGRKRTVFKDDPYRPWAKTLNGALPYDDETLAFVAKVYSTEPSEFFDPGVDRQITVADLKTLIREIEAVPTLPFVLDNWVLRHLVVFDDL